MEALETLDQFVKGEAKPTFVFEFAPISILFLSLAIIVTVVLSSLIVKAI